MAKNQKILLADPNYDWLKEANIYFTKDNYEVLRSEDGKRAQLAIYNNKIFAAILNFELKDYNVFSVIKYIKTHQPMVKIILTLSSENLMVDAGLNRKLLEKQGLTDIFIAPFTLDQIKATLDGYQKFAPVSAITPEHEGQKSEVHIDIADEQFTGIKIEEFISGQRVQFDIFIQLSSGRYLKILHAGDSFSKDRINKYKDEFNVKYLYILTKDRSKYIQFGEYLVGKLAKNDFIRAETKLQLLKNVGEKIVEEFYSEGVRPQMLEESKNFCKNIREIITRNNGIAQILHKWEDIDPSAYTHGYLVGLFSCLLAKQLNWRSDFMYETLGLASILHDIGYTQLPQELVQKQEKEMTPEELTLFRQHPHMSVDILNKNKINLSTIDQVILQHHEKSDGTGYPNGIQGQKILPIAKIISLADDFSQFLVFEKLPPVKAIRFLLAEKEFVQKHGAKTVAEFIKIFSDNDKIDL